LPELPGRRRAAILAAMTAILVASLIGPGAASAAAPPNLAAFKYALGQVESGGNYYARNPYSGAYGKYQIMPSNWPGWAETYLGNRYAKQTPDNQEKVASGKLTSLYRSLDSWRRVAYWWLTGSKATTGWSTYASSYVAKVMKLYEAAKSDTQAAPTPTDPPATRYGERSERIEYAGDWDTATHVGYTGDAVRFTGQAGATASFSFAGSKVTWYGPTGPTRGKAIISIDGRYVKTVDLYSSSFDPREALFRKSWTRSGRHTLTIEVHGTKGRPLVAIDEFLVVP
jgi:hypothetical protein